MAGLKVVPLNAIRAFEAAARHQSFKRAAEELSVTHGAVSRQISLLESWLGTPLFRRLNRQVVLTDAGSTLFAEVSPALQRIALATSSVSQKAKSRVLVLNAPPTFLMRWLIPRISTFLQKHERLEIKLETSVKPVDFAKGGYDMAIRRAPEVPAGLRSRVFLREMQAPVCSPALLRGKPLKQVSDLKSHTLLHAATSPLSWLRWFESAHVTDWRGGKSLQFEELYFTLQAAINGMGIAIAPAALVADDVRANRLCFPFKFHYSRDYDYRLLYSSRADNILSIEDFSAWLCEEGRKSEADGERLLTGPLRKPTPSFAPSPRAGQE